MYGAFLSARHFQQTAGIQNFLDANALGAQVPRSGLLLFRQGGATRSRRSAARTRCSCWSTRRRTTSRGTSASAPIWRRTGATSATAPDVDEYLRRQHLSARDYQAFVGRLKREFPEESFLIVRFGDHQPYFARSMIDPAQDDTMLARRIAAADPRFLTTYYAINTINFTPRDMSSAADALDAPYLPLVVLEAAGVPLDPRSPSRRRSCSAATGCSIAATAAPRRAASTGC